MFDIKSGCRKRKIQQENSVGRRSQGMESVIMQFYDNSWLE